MDVPRKEMMNVASLLGSFIVYLMRYSVEEFEQPSLMIGLGASHTWYMSVPSMTDTLRSHGFPV